MPEPTLKTRIHSKNDGTLISLAAKAAEVAEDTLETYRAIRTYAVGRTWADVLARFPCVKREWTYRKAARRKSRTRCFYRTKHHEWDTAPGYDGAAERERYARAQLAYVEARTKEPGETAKEERLADARAFLAKHSRTAAP